MPIYITVQCICKKVRHHWLEFFTDLKRLDWVIDNHPTKAQVVEHIQFNSEAKIVLQYGDHYFTIGGQHRLCLAKLLELEEVEVDVIIYSFDRKRFIQEKRLEQHIPALMNEGFLSKYYEKNSRHDFVAINSQKDTIYLSKQYTGYLLRRLKERRKFPYRGIMSCIKANQLQSYNKSRIGSDKDLYLLLKHNKSILTVLVN